MNDTPAIRHFGFASRGATALSTAAPETTSGVSVEIACAGRLATMAHEMVHLPQRPSKMETPGAHHNAAFHKLARSKFASIMGLTRKPSHD